METGERLKQLRKGSGLTQEQLAQRLGVQKSVVSFYERGDRLPSIDILVKYATLFHVTTDYLLGLERMCTLDVSGLDDGDVEVLRSVADALRRKR